MKHFLRLLPVSKPILKKMQYGLLRLNQRSLHCRVVRLFGLTFPVPFWHFVIFVVRH